MFRNADHFTIGSRYFSHRSSNANIRVFQDSRYRIAITHDKYVRACVRDLVTDEYFDIKPTLSDYEMMEELEKIIRD